MNWSELGRPEQNVLQSLYGGGSLRNCDPSLVLSLRRMGLIGGKERREQLSPLGWKLMRFTHAKLNARIGIAGLDR